MIKLQYSKFIYIQAFLKSKFSNDDFFYIDDLTFYISFLRNKPYFTIQNENKSLIHFSKIDLLELEAILRPLVNTYDCYKKVDINEYKNLLQR